MNADRFTPAQVAGLREALDFWARHGRVRNVAVVMELASSLLRAYEERGKEIERLNKTVWEFARVRDEEHKGIDDALGFYPADCEWLESARESIFSQDAENERLRAEAALLRTLLGKAREALGALTDEARGSRVTLSEMEAARAALRDIEEATDV